MRPFLKPGPTRRRLLRHTWQASLLALGLGLVSAPALADYPEQPVRLLVGFSAGGTTDVLARILAKELTESLGQPVVVENRPGASSNIATEAAARAKPDGHTLLMVAVTSAVNQSLFKSVGFDLQRDFAPVALAARVPNVLVVNPQVPANTVQELVEYAKANPDKVAFASSGSGTSTHMAGELFKMEAGLQTLHVPYKGSAPAMTDLVGGQVQYIFDNMPSAWPHVQNGRLRALAVTTAERSASAPDVPTMIESGFPTFDVTSWFGVLAPAGTPPEVVERLHRDIQAALAKPEVQERFAALGALPGSESPAAFGTFIDGEVARWAKVVEASGATVD